MTAQTDGWLKELGTQGTEDVLDQPLPNRDESPRGIKSKPGIQSPRPRRGKRFVPFIALAVIVFTAGYGVGAYVFSQTINGTVGAQPVSGSSSFNVGTVPVCNQNCNGTLISGTSGYAVVFTVTAINALVSSSDQYFSSLWLVPTTLTACGAAQGGTGWIQVPQTQGAISVSAQKYNYCLFYSIFATGTSISVSISYSV